MSNDTNNFNGGGVEELSGLRADVKNVKEAVNEVKSDLKDWMKEFRVYVENSDNKFVKKEDHVELASTVKSHDRTLKYFYGIAVGVLYFLNFIQNGGIDSVK